MENWSLGTMHLATLTCVIGLLPAIIVTLHLAAIDARANSITYRIPTVRIVPRHATPHPAFAMLSDCND